MLKQYAKSTLSGRRQLRIKQTQIQNVAGSDFQGNTWKDCPIRDAECRGCHKKGHIAKKCRSTGGVHDITEVHMESKEDKDFAFLGEMCSEGEEEWMETLHLNGEATVFKLNTGASVKAISRSNYSIKKHGTLQPPL